MTSCSYSTDGRLIAAGLADGQIQLWDVRGEGRCPHMPMSRPCNGTPAALTLTSPASLRPGKFGHSAAVGLVPVPKPQQALFTKQTWTYASKPGGDGGSGWVGGMLPACTRAPHQADAHSCMQHAERAPVLAALQGKWCGTRMRQAATSPVCASPSMARTCCPAAKVSSHPALGVLLSGICFPPLCPHPPCHTLLLGADGSLKLWDLRKFKAPLATADNLPCNYRMTQVRRQRAAQKRNVWWVHFSDLALPRPLAAGCADVPPCCLPCYAVQCCFSPDDKFVLTGTSAEGKDSSGALVVLDSQSLEKLGEVAVDGSAVAVQASRQLARALCVMVWV